MKKQQILLVSFFLMISLNSFSQIFDKLLNVKYKPGFAILNNRDTLTGSFEFNDTKQNYLQLVYINPVSHKKSVYNPDEVTFFCLDSSYYFPKELKDGWEFVKLISNDSMKVYLHRRFFTTNIASGDENQIMFEKPDGEYLLVSFNNFYPFKSKVGDFFSDDPDLSKKIYTNKYTKDDVLKIAFDYNNWLLKKGK